MEHIKLSQLQLPGRVFEDFKAEGQQMRYLKIAATAALTARSLEVCVTTLVRLCDEFLVVARDIHEVASYCITEMLTIRAIVTPAPPSGLLSEGDELRLTDAFKDLESFTLVSVFETFTLHGAPLLAGAKQRLQERRSKYRCIAAMLG